MVMKLVSGAILLFTCHGFPFPLHERWPLAPWQPPSSVVARKEALLRYRLQANAIADTEVEADTPTLQVSNASARLDPLLTSFLLRSVRNNGGASPTNNEHDDTTTNFFTFSDATKAMIGLQTWETSLRKARLPLLEDFSTNNNQHDVWPKEPLFGHVYDILSELGMPRLVRRHPEILTSVLLGVAKFVIEFIKAQKQGKLVIVEQNVDDDDDVDYDDRDDVYETPEFEYEPLSTEELDQLSDSLANNLKQEWGGVIQGVAMLDKVFGYDHGLLDMQVNMSYLLLTLTIVMWNIIMDTFVC